MMAPAFGVSDCVAQCTLQGSQYPAATIAAPTTVGQTVTVSTCNFGGDFSRIGGMSGTSFYTLSFSGGGYITVFSLSDQAVAWGNSPLGFVPPASGTYKVQWSASAPPACGTDGNCHQTGIQLTAFAPQAPPAPVQDPAPPACATGSFLTISGSPELGTEWYWQDSPTGTSTAVPYTGTYHIPANGTYYVRAHNAYTTLWSAVSSVVVNNFPLAPVPPAPVADVNPACAPQGAMLTAATPPAGTTYYWQTAPEGISTANPASTALHVTVSGTYYLAANESASQCWSPTTALSVTVDVYEPPLVQALADTVFVCAGALSVPVQVMPPATSDTAVIQFASGYQLVPGTSTLAGTLNIPPGATVNSSVLTFDGITTAQGQFLQDISFSLSGASVYPNTSFTGNQATDAGPFDYNTVTDPAGGAVTLTMSNIWNQSASISSITLTVVYALPTTNVNWYDAATGGMDLGVGDSLELVGTSVLPNTSAAGDYTVYARATIGGCSGTATPVTVRVKPLSATLQAVDAGCNGAGDGSFVAGGFQCGSGNYLYSVNGGAFGPIPTDLAAATYSVVIQDQGTMQVSAPIPVVIAEPVPITGDFSITQCGPFVWNSQSYGVSGSYEQVFTAAGGCDSTVTLHLTISDATTGSQTVAACGGYTWPVNGQAYASGGTYTHTLLNGAGCDSVVTLHLTVNPVPEASVSGDLNGTITASGNGSYVWIDCATNGIIVGAAGQTFTPAENGTYAVVVENQFGCGDTSSCITVSGLGGIDIFSAAFGIYPNPTDGMLQVMFGTVQDFVVVEVVDISGKTVAQYRKTASSNIQLYISGAAGIYNLRVTTPQGTAVRKIVLQR